MRPRVRPGLSNRESAYTGFIESFHSTLRRDHLDVEVPLYLLDAQLKTGIYKNYYNEVRPHSALGYKQPIEYATMEVKSLRWPLVHQVGADQVHYGKSRPYIGWKANQK
jgi:hypothetical protein